MAWIEETLPYRKVRILCVGDQAGSFAGDLAAKGYQRLAVLGDSDGLGSRDQCRQIQWIDGDFTRFLPVRAFSLWFDPGLFRSLKDPASRLAYGHAVWNSLLPGGLVLVATPVTGELSLTEALGPAFRLCWSRSASMVQNDREIPLVYSLFERI